MLSFLDKGEQPIEADPPKAIIGWMTGMTIKEKKELAQDIYSKIKGESLETIKNILKNYEDNIIVDMIGRYIDQNIIKRILSDILPYTDQSIIYRMTNTQLPVDKIESVSDRININYLYKENCTCLFYITDMEYLISLLSSEKLNFDINHINKFHNTFLTTIFTNERKITNVQFKTIMDILIRKKYDFTKIYIGASLLDIICLSSSCNINIIIDTMCIPNYDITVTTLWLYTLIKSLSVNHMRIIISYILTRQDHKSFLNTIMNSYFYASAETDILFIMNLIKSMNNTTLSEMITYKNTDGNTILHIASMHRLKKTIRFIKRIPNLIFEKNIDGKTPYDLYIDSSVEKILLY